MKSLLSWRYLPLCAILFVSVLSCKKNDGINSPTGQQQTETLLMNATNAAADATNLESQDMEDVVASDSSSDCRTITFDTSKTVYPHVRTINFGNGCTGDDGITRKGKRITTFYANAATAAPGTMVSETTFQDYYVNDINVTGTVTAYIDSASTSDTLIMKLVANKALSSTEGDTKTINAVNYWKKIEGNTTLNRQDDVYEITGSASGNETLDGATQIEWTSQTDAAKPVIKPVSCDHRTQGGLNIQLHIITGGDATFTEYLDYGDGTCDDVATLSINGGTPKEVTLPLYFWPLSL